MSNLVVNVRHIRFLEMQHDASHHEGWKQMLKNVKSLDQELNESNFKTLTRNVPIAGWTNFTMWTRIFECTNNLQQNMYLFANWLVVTCSKFTENHDCIKKLRDGSWFDYRSKFWENKYKNNNNKNGKKIYNQLSQYRNYGNYDVQYTKDTASTSEQKMDDLPPKQDEYHKIPFKEWDTSAVIKYLGSFVELSEAQKNAITVNQLKGKHLEFLDHDALQSIGFTLIGDRIKLIQQIQALYYHLLPVISPNINTISFPPSIFPEPLATINETDNSFSNKSKEISSPIPSVSTPTISESSTSSKSENKPSKHKYTEIKISKKRKIKEWWQTDPLFLDKENGNKQIRKIFKLKWVKDMKSCGPAASMGLVALSIMETATQKQIKQFCSDYFPEIKQASTLGLLLPSKTCHVTMSGSNGFEFDIENESGKWAKKSIDKIIEKNDYLTQIKAEYDKKGNQSEEIQKHIDEKTETVNINKNDKKRKLSISTVDFGGLTVESVQGPPRKKQKM